jgi:hypothetical protein
MHADRRKLLTEAGLTEDALRTLAAAPQGEWRVRALLADVRGPLLRADDALLDALSADAGSPAFLGRDVLRRLCRTPLGVHLACGVLADSPAPQVPYGRPYAGLGWRLARPWLLVLGVAMAGLLVCAALTPFLGGLVVLVGLALLVFAILPLSGRVWGTPGYGAAIAAMALAWLVLMFTLSFSAGNWYLAVRGRQVRGTVAAPTHVWAHGTRVAYCRVRLPDGTLREIRGRHPSCVDGEGRATAVVYDPRGWFPPQLGTKAGLGVAVSGGVAAGSAAALLLVPAVAVGLGVRRVSAGVRR